ncbi:MAG: putative 2-aminoethylphosphonate ABC transporter permease subunit [Candidatus Methylopumilus sp.]|nr:putative 2-aminoethylphosphonate ABC transporter permease subunit [Candidatus Methylopumilus sp.]
MTNWQQLDSDSAWMRVVMLLLGLWLLVTLVLPLGTLLSKSFADANGTWVGLNNYASYFATPSLTDSLWNSVWVSTVVACITLTLAYVYAFALTRSAMPGKVVFKALALIPIFAPSLLPAISLVYLFGNQGFLKDWLFGTPIYGPLGIVIAQVFYCFPHALMILVVALSMADARHYEAARVLGASPFRTFTTVTLPGSKYGLISAGFVVFTLAITDFGIPKVIGGQFNVLATDIFKQVIGQQNFSMGAVVGFALLLPAVIAFVADRWVQHRQVALLSGRSVPLVPSKHTLRDIGLLIFCTLVAGAFLLILGMAVWASFVTRWPYNLNLTWANYHFENFDSDGWNAYFNSLRMAAWTAVVGTLVVFTGAFVLEKTRGFVLIRHATQLMAMLSMAVPGLVLGLSYIFFFNAPGNPLGFIYGTMAILVLNSVAHFYTVSHITATTALKQLDSEFESVSTSLKISIGRMFKRVTVPVCLPAILDISIYFFVNAMTTVSAVIFLYGSNTKLAAVSIVQMDEAGSTAAAAAMAVVIVATSVAVKVVHSLLTYQLRKKTQAWRLR